jgi:hypothetical protein
VVGLFKTHCFPAKKALALLWHFDCFLLGADRQTKKQSNEESQIALYSEEIIENMLLIPFNQNLCQRFLLIF